jgi:hypothetical protein
MTIDERIEALTMNLELVSHDLEELIPLVKDLVRVAEMHEARITKIEGKRE